MNTAQNRRDFFITNTSRGFAYCLIDFAIARTNATTVVVQERRLGYSLAKMTHSVEYQESKSARYKARRFRRIESVEGCLGGRTILRSLMPSQSRKQNVRR